jgi:hypothetical protein
MLSSKDLTQVKAHDKKPRRYAGPGSSFFISPFTGHNPIAPGELGQAV